MPVKVESRSISVIAQEIKATWGKGSMAPIYFGARPYLSAMYCLNTIKDKYSMDDAWSIILYFLANAESWTGADARRIKKELNNIVKGRGDK